MKQGILNIGDFKYSVVSEDGAIKYYYDNGYAVYQPSGEQKWFTYVSEPRPGYVYDERDYLMALYHDDNKNAVSRYVHTNKDGVKTFAIDSDDNAVLNDSVEGDLDHSVYALVGGEVLEAQNGRVLSASEKDAELWGYNGTFAIYNSELDKTFIYWHLAEGSINEDLQGETIAPGTLIGLEGETGLSFGKHTHVEVHQGRSYIDMSNPWSPKSPANSGRLDVRSVFQEAVQQGLVSASNTSDNLPSNLAIGNEPNNVDENRVNSVFNNLLLSRWEKTFTQASDFVSNKIDSVIDYINKEFGGIEGLFSILENAIDDINKTKALILEDGQLSNEREYVANIASLLDNKDELYTVYTEQQGFQIPEESLLNTQFTPSLNIFRNDSFSYKDFLTATLSQVALDKSNQAYEKVRNHYLEYFQDNANLFNEVKNKVSAIEQKYADEASRINPSDYRAFGNSFEERLRHLPGVAFDFSTRLAFSVANLLGGIITVLQPQSVVVTETVEEISLYVNNFSLELVYNVDIKSVLNEPDFKEQFDRLYLVGKDIILPIAQQILGEGKGISSVWEEAMNFLNDFESSKVDSWVDSGRNFLSTLSPISQLLESFKTVPDNFKQVLQVPIIIDSFNKILDGIDDAQKLLDTIGHLWKSSNKSMEDHIFNIGVYTFVTIGKTLVEFLKLTSSFLKIWSPSSPLDAAVNTLDYSFNLIQNEFERSLAENDNLYHVDALYNYLYDFYATQAKSQEEALSFLEQKLIAYIKEKG